MITTVILVVITLILSAFFSGSEIAYLSANKLSIEVLKNKGSGKGRILAALYANPKSFLSTMLVGNNIVLVVYTILFSSIVLPFLSYLLPQSPPLVNMLNTLILTVVILIFGEYLPKTIFRMYANELIFRLAYVINFFKWLMAIPSWILTSSSNVLLKIFFPKMPTELEQSFTRLDLEKYITSNVNEEKDIDKEILANALNLNQLKVRDCMVPRNEIVFVDKHDELQDIKEVFVQSKHSRILVTDGDIENIVGYLHQQVLFKNPTSVKRHIMELEFVPEVMNVQDLMYKFIRSGTNIAVVVDEFGGTAGIITLEDILEEIFGEIDDEHDEEEFVENVLSENEYEFSGRLELDYLNNKYPGLDLPEEDYVTLSGYIVMTHGSIPEQGEEITLGNHKFEILQKSDTKIETVRVVKLYEQPDEESES